MATVTVRYSSTTSTSRLLSEPGGWNRFSIEVADLAGMVAGLREAGVHFRNEIVTGVGGKEILLDDPSGNPIEVFEPVLGEASLSAGSWGSATGAPCADFSSPPTGSAPSRC